MPDGLSLRVSALLVVLAFGLTFAVQALLGGGSSAPEPAAKTSDAELAADAQGRAPKLRVVAAATVPTLREPRQPRTRRPPPRKPKRSVRTVVKAAPRSTPAPVKPAATVRPAPTAAPRHVPPAPRHTTPVPKPKPAAPKPTPAPTSPPPSGEFDTSGDQ